MGSALLPSRVSARCVASGHAAALPSSVDIRRAAVDQTRRKILRWYRYLASAIATVTATAILTAPPAPVVTCALRQSYMFPPTTLDANAWKPTMLLIM